MKNLIVLLFLLGGFTGITQTQFNWEHTSGPFGSVLSFIYSNDLYAFIPEDDFLYRSADGISWEKLVHPVSFFMGVYKDTLVNILYTPNLDTLHLQLSYDNGDSWIIKDLPDQFTSPDDIVMTSHGIYFAQSHKDLLFKSTDLGETWDTVDVPIEFYALKNIDNRLYIHGSSAMWRTDEVGDSWEDITPTLDTFVYVDDVVAKDSHIIISSETFLFHSHDSGQTWGQFSTAWSNATNKLTLVGDQVYASIDLDLLRSDDFGMTWDTLTTFIPTLSMVTSTGFKDMYLKTTFNKGVYRWDDAEGALMESNDGFSKGYVYDLAVGQDKIWAACGNGVFAYDVLTETWSDKMNIPLPFNEYDFISANDHGWVMVAGVFDNEFYLTENNGLNWDTIPIPEDQLYYLERMQMVDEVLFLASDFSLYRSTDKGLSWDFVIDDYINTEIIRHNNQLFMVGNGLLYTSSDNGTTWSNAVLPIEIIELYSFGGLLYAISSHTGIGATLYTSLDAEQWTYAGDGFPGNYAVHGFYESHNSFFFRDADYYYSFLKWQGHYVSQDDSFLWSILPTSHTGNAYAIHDNVIYLGGNGVYKTEIENPFITSIKNESIQTKELLNVSPNPAIDFIHVEIKQKEFPGEVTLFLYNSKGDFLKSNTYSSVENIRVDVHDLPSGIYFLQAHIGDHTGMIKVIKQ